MINRFKWLEVSPETRKNIVIFLNDVEGFSPLLRTGGVEVAGNKVVCDGFTDQDLCAITNELLVAALGEHTLEPLGINKADIYALFYELVRRIEMPPVVLEYKETPVVENIVEKVDDDQIIKKDINKNIAKKSK